MDTLIGIPVHDKDRLGLPYTPPSDRTIKECDECGMDIYVGPRILAVIAATGARVYCPHCVIRLGLGGPDSDISSLGGT